MVDPTPTAAFQDIAAAKLDRILGPTRGPEVLAAALARVGLARIDTAEELFRVGQDLERQGGFTATIGALLCLSAVMHGAVGQRG
jgi:hypothetical protein